MSIKRVAVLFSSEGTNMENLIKKLHKKSFGDLRVEIAMLLTNNPDAKGIDRASKLGFETVIVDHKEFDNREDFDKALVKKLQEKKIDLAVLAGFMRILTPVFTKNIYAINIHPSLLPAFKGAKALERSYKSSESLAGVTTHFVNEELDGGEIIEQKSFKKDGLDFEKYQKKIKEIEYEIYPSSVIKALKSLA
jgi:phosphoribosylglycinamide formyltransferase-1